MIIAKLDREKQLVLIYTRSRAIDLVVSAQLHGFLMELDLRQRHLIPSLPDEKAFSEHRALSVCFQDHPKISIRYCQFCTSDCL